MEYKVIGNTKVPVIGQGTQGIHDVDVIKRGIDLGMTFIDTAEVYQNEEIIGEAIKGQRDKVFISDKFAPEHNGYEDVIKSCEASLKRLGTDYIDLYQLHWSTPNVPLTETMSALEWLARSGRIRWLGVCNLSLKELGEYDIDSFQVEYNLFDRSAENEILPYCEANNILTIAYSPLMDLYRLPLDRILWLEEIAFKYQRSLSQVALNWLVSHKSVIVIPKSKDIRHQKLNATSSDFTLALEDLKRIDELFAFEISYIDPKLIKVSKTGKFPQTLDEALKNITHFTPSPLELSKDLEDIKPVRVEYRTEGFELVEGGLRYWAWVMKHDKPIPALIIGEPEQIYKPEEKKDK